jgi:L-fuculose-phosphate aldolase
VVYVRSWHARPWHRRQEDVRGRYGRVMGTTTIAERLAKVARQTSESGLNQGRTGNASVRIDGGCAITPSGVELARVTASDLVAIDLDGALMDSTGVGVASSEWRLHTEIYRARPEIGGVVHCHSIAATGISALRTGIPAFHYMVPALGGADIRCTGYAIYGSAGLAAETVRALDGRTACLLANHGVVACGTTPEDALEAAVMVETLAAQYLAARQLGDPVLLPAAEIDELIAGFATYRALTIATFSSGAPHDVSERTGGYLEATGFGT